MSAAIAVKGVVMDIQTDLEFTDFLLNKAAEAKREVKFPGTKFVRDLHADGGYQTVLRLLHKKDVSEGFTDLCMLGRADLTVEALIVESKWRGYFDKVLIELAEARLAGAKYRYKRYQDSGAALAPSTVAKPAPSPDNQRLEAGKTSRRHWWVNQNQTYKAEVPGGFLWSPKTRTDGVRNQFYENMREVVAGDVVFSFCDGLIKAVGVAQGSAKSSPKPAFGNAGTNWANEGWMVEVDFTELKHQVRPKEQIAQLREHLPEKYSPLTDEGNGLQSVYLAAVPPAMATVLVQLIGPEFEAILASCHHGGVSTDEQDEEVEAAIRGRTDLDATTKLQLVKARRGQGLFKSNVRLNETRCRVTGISDIAHLRASHIKPWRVSNDQEKLDGCNGLLLAPHVDHLFDRGLISFTSDGGLLVSQKLDPTILTSWGIPVRLNVGRFKPEQAQYLEFHQQQILVR